MKKRFIFKKLFLGMILLILITGCKKPQPETNYSIPTGIWTSAYDAFEVKSSPDEFYYYCDTSKSVAMAGNILQTNQNGSSGYWVLQITQNSSSCGSWSMNYSYFIVGKYTVVRWKEMNVSGTSVKQATPYKDGSGLGAESYNSQTDAVNTLINSVNASSIYFGMINSSIYNQ